MSSSVSVDKKGKYILILDKGPAQELDNTTLAAEKIYFIHFTEQQKNFVYV